MSEISPRVEMPALRWSDDGVSGHVPTGTVTLLLADAEGSTRLWETAPEKMTAAFANLDRTLAELVSAHHGVRPVEQGEGDSFVVAFTRASDAVACALALQRAPLAPIRLRIGIHTGEVRLRDEDNYIGPAINRTARIRDLGYGGQTLLSGTTSDLVADLLPDGAWLFDLGTHPLRDLPRPERIVQLRHPDLHNEFPPLRVHDVVANPRLPLRLTRFIGRVGAINQIAELLSVNRLVTLVGAGGVGKTRLAVQVAAAVAGRYPDGVWYVDLAPISDSALVPVTAARALGLPDQPGRSPMESMTWFIGTRRMMVVLDNCEHVLDACAALSVGVLGACPGLTLLATSREPIGVDGEQIWRVPSLSLADEAVELFTDRARRARPDFTVTAADEAAVTEICQRLDGMPLAIELAAARVRTLSLVEIVDTLYDRFRLLTGGSRTAVRRQQTLRASVDWSHALLTEPERVVFRRLAVFMGSFDLIAAEAVAGDTEVERHQVLDLLSLLVDKSLLVSEGARGPTRYRLLETVRQYSQEKLGESGEADAVRCRHRDHYTAMAARLDNPAHADDGRTVEQIEREIDNLRAAFAWSREGADITLALQLASSLQPLWLTRGRLREGLAWLKAALAGEGAQDSPVPPAVRARALADKAWLDATVISTDSTDGAEEALAIARELDDPALLSRALVACGAANGYNPEVAPPYFVEALELARTLGDSWTVSLILGWQAVGAVAAGNPVGARAAAEEGRELADAVGDPFTSRLCRWSLGVADMAEGNLAAAAAQLRDLAAEADAAHDLLFVVSCLYVRGQALAYQGDTDAARAAATAAVQAAAQLGGWHEGLSYLSLGIAALADGDVAGATDALTSGWDRIRVQPETAGLNRVWMSQAALARGDVDVARSWAEDAVAATTGLQLSAALTIRARVAFADGDSRGAERDAHDALACAADIKALLLVPDILDCLARLAAEATSHSEAARLFGAAEAVRSRTGEVRFKIYQADYEACVAGLRDVMGEAAFDAAWTQGAALSTEEAVAYAQRGRGSRKRAATGWEALTPTERDVVGLVIEGLGNKEAAAKLFISPRTVQTHLTHAYAKLGVTSRMQLAQEAARRRRQLDAEAPRQ
ncbi:LuxR family transcriptional regulator [Mycobacterium sp. NPDC050551]|uniref:helix-turn-helix transcriptional regulator n=1 Tax=Mycobacterium sp. NPDC050551 TaxID=3155407 RepID=UPI003414CD21